MSNVTSTLDIVLKDDVSRSAATIEASLKKMEAEAKAVDAALGKSGTGDKFQANLKKMGAGVVHVEALTKGWQDYAKAEALAANRSDWTGKQLAQVKTWEAASLTSIRAVMSGEKQLQAQQHARAESLRRDMERAAHRQEHQASHHGFMNYALTSAAMAVSAHGIMSVVEGAIEHGAEYQHKLVAMQNTGRTPAEIEEMNRASHAALRGVPTATLTGNLEILNETVSAFGSVEHAMEHLGFMAKSAAVLHAVAGDKISDSAGEMGNNLARFFEMRGTAGNSKVFEHEAEEMMKGMVFTGGGVNPRELRNFAIQAKSSLQNYDLHFLSRIVPSLINELHSGEKAGTQANAFANVILGKARDKKQAAAWKKYGLIDPKQMSADGTGWTGGAVYHTDLALRDPLAFGEQFLLKQLATHGVDTNNQLELTKVLGTLFRNTMSNAFANELWQTQNRNRLHKDDHYTGQVDSLDTIYQRLLKTDPTVAVKALKDAVGNLLTTTTSPLMGTAARSMSGLAENLNQLAVAADDNPMTAATAGIVTAAGALYGAGRASMAVMNGFGGSIARGISAEITGSMAGVGGVVSKAIAAEVTEVVGGGLSVGALEVAATGAITMTAGSVALVGLTAVGIIAALRASMDPKHQAANDPGFGDPFAPGKGGIDFNDPKYKSPEDRTDAEKQQLKHWWDRDGGGHARGGTSGYHDTDQPGHWAYGRAGTAPHWVLEDRSPMKNAPYFATAPLGPDGLPLGSMPNGWNTGRGSVDPTTGSRIGWGSPPTDPALYSPANAPLPPPRPMSDLERRTFGNYIDTTRPMAADGGMPQATLPPNFDTSNLDAATAKAHEAHAALDGLNVTVSPQVSMAALDALIAKAREARAEIAAIGSAGGGTTQTSFSPRRSMAPHPTVRTTI